MSREHPANLACSFCGKSQREVRKLVAGPDVYVCDECITLCWDILGEEQAVEAGVVRALDQSAFKASSAARRFAAVCEKAVELPRPVAERARALAEEIEATLAENRNARIVLTEYASSMAIMSRRFAAACEAVELPRRLAERAAALADEIESLIGK